MIIKAKYRRSFLGRTLVAVPALILLLCGVLAFAGYQIYSCCVKTAYIERSEIPMEKEGRKGVLADYGVEGKDITDVYYSCRMDWQVMDSYLRLDTAKGRADEVAGILSGYLKKNNPSAEMTKQDIDSVGDSPVVEELQPLPWWGPGTIKRGHRLTMEDGMAVIWVDLDNDRIYASQHQ